MHILSLLVKLGMMKSVCSNPVCDDSCTLVTAYHQPQVKHLHSDLPNSSVAPWSLEREGQDDRLPHSIQRAVCSNCSIPGMDVKPIHVGIQVYHKIKGCPVMWCRCPYELPVGCTCVKNSQKS